MSEVNQQIVARPAQMSMFGIFDAKLERAFTTKEIKDKNGNVVGASMVIRGAKERGQNYELKGKDNAPALAIATLDDRDEGMKRVKQHLAGLNGDTTLAKFSHRILANGVEATTIVTHKIKRTPKGDTPEMIAAKLGLPVEKVIEMIERQTKATQPVDVTSATVTPPAGENPATGTQEAPEPIVT